MGEHPLFSGPTRTASLFVLLVLHYLLPTGRLLPAAPRLGPADVLPGTIDADGFLTGLDATFFLSAYLTTPFDVDKLVYSLRSYRSLRVKWRSVYLLVHPGPDLTPPPLSLIEAEVSAAFPGLPLTLHWRRPETQAEWRPHVDALTRNGTAPATSILWFFNNHDHPFVDSAPDVLHEALRRLVAEPKRYKSLSLSHWPEYVRAAGKGGHPELRGRTLRFEDAMTDSYQVFSAPMVRYLFVELDWRGKPFTRTDFLVVSARVWDVQRVVGLPLEVRLDSDGEELMAIYVPLREQCRHFTAYLPMLPPWMYPPLDLSHAPSSYAPNLNDTDSHVLTRFMPEHENLWTRGNTFEFPQEVLRAVLLAHGRRPKEGALLEASAEWGWKPHCGLNLCLCCKNGHN